MDVMAVQGCFRVLWACRCRRVHGRRSGDEPGTPRQRSDLPPAGRIRLSAAGVGGVLHQAAASRLAIRGMLNAAALQTIVQFVFLRPRNIGRRRRPYCFIQPNGLST